MRRFASCRLAVALTAGGLLLAPAAVRAADFPGPSNNAALYEAAKKEGEITWYTSFSPETEKVITTAFSKRYPGITVKTQLLVGLAQYQRFVLETEAKQYIADMLQIADRPSMQDLIQRKLVAPWRVPTIDRYDDAAKLDDYSYAPYLVVNSITFNKNKVTPEEIEILRKDWKGLLDPRFKGRIAATDQPGAPTYSPVYMFMDPKFSSRYGLEFLKQLAGIKAPIYSTSPAALDRVIAGEQDIAYWASVSIPFGGYMRGAPVGWVYPAPTPIGATVWWAVATTAPHPNAARLYMNWLMSEEGQHAYQAAGWTAAMKGIPDENPAAKEPWYKPVADPYIISDFDRWDREQDKDTKIWIDLLRSNSAAR